MICWRGQAKSWQPDSPEKLVKPLPDIFAPPPGLVQHLCARGLVVDGAPFETLFGGRTNQVWKVLGHGSDKVLKVYRTSLRNPLFRNDAELEARCLNALADTGFTPRLRAAGQHGGDRWVFYDHAPGVPWQNGSENVGALLSRLHALQVPVAAPAGCNGSAALVAHGQRILDACTSDTALELARLQPVGRVDPTSRTCLIHGDPVAGNILVDDTTLTLIDWQCPAVGDPCEDLAFFLSPAMQHLYRGKPLDAAEEERFLCAYGQPEITDRYHALRPWYAWRMAAYCLWRVETGAPDYEHGLRLELQTLRSTLLP